MDRSVVLIVTCVYGFLMIYLIGTIANFFIPVNAIFSHVLMGLGVLLLGLNRKLISRYLRAKEYILIGSSFVLMACTLFIWSPAGLNYDFNLYHMQTIKWFTSENLPFGLAHLHGRLGFNVSWHLIMSILEQPLLSNGKFIFISLPILLFFYLSSLLITLCEASALLRFSAFFFLISGVCLCSAFLYFDFQAEALVLILGLLCLLFVLRIWENKETSFNDDTCFLLLCAFFSITIKVTSIVFAAACVMSVLLFYLLKKQLSALYRMLAAAAACGLLILSPMLAKSVILTGCLIYPVPFLRIGALKWSLSSASVTSEKNSITGWARWPGEAADKVLASHAWLEPWLERFFQNPIVEILLLVMLAGVILLIIQLFGDSKPGKGADPAAFLLAALIPLCSIVFWFIHAPDVRFGLAGLYGLASIVFSVAAYRILHMIIDLTSRHQSRKALAKTFTARKALSSKASGRKASEKQPSDTQIQSRASRNTAAITHYFSVSILLLMLLCCGFYITEQDGLQALQYKASLTAEALQAKNRVKAVENRTIEGQLIYTPSTSDQTYSMPLPAAPYFNPSLKIQRSTGGHYDMFWIEKE